MKRWTCCWINSGSRTATVNSSPRSTRGSSPRALPVKESWVFTRRLIVETTIPGVTRTLSHLEARSQNLSSRSSGHTPGWFVPTGGLMLKEGNKAPSFSVQDDQGRTVNLSDFAGKKDV